jgi:hypothetical protein
MVQLVQGFDPARVSLLPPQAHVAPRKTLGLVQNLAHPLQRIQLTVESQ